MIKRLLSRLFARIFCLHDEWEKCKDDDVGFIMARNKWRCKRCGKIVLLAPGDKPVGADCNHLQKEDK